MANDPTDSRYDAGAVAGRAAREAGIAGALSERSERTHHVPFHGGYIEAPVVRVDERLLAYRSDNGRLFSEMVALGESREQRDDAAQQQLLHGLLLAKARDPKGPIYGELERNAKQTEPLLVSPDGIVVNGNRRLASMRELRARDPGRYARFAEVEVAVLPAGLSPEDIEYIEAALQMAPELKLDYSWVNRRLKLRDHVERMGIDSEELRAAWRFEDVAAIETELAELTLTERFLQYRGTPGDYEAVVDLEDELVAMQRELSVLNNKPLIDLWTYAGFAMLAEREALDRAIGHHFPFTRPVPFALVHWGMRSLAEEEGLAAPQTPGENKPVLPELAERLMPIVRDRGRARHVALRITALGDRLRANQDQEIGSAQVVQNLAKAKQGLQRLDVATLSAVQVRQIRDELIALSDHLADFGGGGRKDERRSQPASLMERILGRG